MHIGLVIKKQREKKGITQRELGLALGLCDQSISNIERGISGLSAKHYHACAKALGLPFRQLLDAGAEHYVTQLKLAK